MDPKEERFVAFWNRHKNRKWRFRIIVGSLYGLFLLLVFSIRTYFFGKKTYDSLFDYLGSLQFLVQFIFLFLICGWILGWIMYRYCVTMDKKIKDKYHES